MPFGSVEIPSAVLPNPTKVEFDAVYRELGSRKKRQFGIGIANH